MEQKWKKCSRTFAITIKLKTPKDEKKKKKNKKLCGASKQLSLTHARMKIEQKKKKKNQM